MNIEGDTYPPPRLNEILSNVMFALRMGLLLLILAGPDALRSIGIQNPPGIYMWAQDNKVLESTLACDLVSQFSALGIIIIFVVLMSEDFMF